METSRRFKPYRLMFLLLIFFILLITSGNGFCQVISSKQLIKPEDIFSEELIFSPDIPYYPLPLEKEEIFNYYDFSQKIQLSPQSISQLQKNGFVVIPTPAEIAENKLRLRFSPDTSSPSDDFVAFYEVLKNKDLPIFITTDSMLHYYHIFFETILMKLEKDLFFNDIWNISLEMLDASLNEYDQGQGDIKEAAKRNAAYLSVALELLRPKEEQMVNDDILRDEYCQPGMDAETCNTIIGQLKDFLGELSSYHYFSVEEGVGYLKTMIVAYQHPEGHILLGVGPVFSYYEFKQPMDERLTDEAWREILDSNPPPEPEWVINFSAK